MQCTNNKKNNKNSGSFLAFAPNSDIFSEQ